MAQDGVDDGTERIDWQAIEASPEFKELVRKKRSFVIPGTIFFLTWYMTFIFLCAFAQDFMGERVYEGLTVGYVLALTQFLMVLVLGLLYLSRSKNVFDPLAEKAIAGYTDTGDGAGPQPGRTTPGAVAPTTTPEAAR